MGKWEVQVQSEKGWIRVFASTKRYIADFWAFRVSLECDLTARLLNKKEEVIRIYYCV